VAVVAGLSNLCHADPPRGVNENAIVVCYKTCGQLNLARVSLVQTLVSTGCWETTRVAALATSIRVKRALRDRLSASGPDGTARIRGKRDFMKATARVSASERLRGEVRLARLQLARAESQLSSAKEQARIARRRRKEAKQAARRAKKQARVAKREVAEVKLALAEAESKLAQAEQRSSKSKIPHSIKRDRVSSSIRKLLRPPKRGVPKSSQPTNRRKKSRSVPAATVTKDADLPPIETAGKRGADVSVRASAEQTNGGSPTRLGSPSAHNQ